MSFDTETNVAAVTIHGKSNKLAARARLREGSEGLVLEGIEATIPVHTLTTGMGLRDDHMRKYVFATPEGKTPDLGFAGEGATCRTGAPPQSVCQIYGQLSVRGTSRPFTIALKAERHDDGFRVRGDGVVKLSMYEIERPSQFGVRTVDDVRVHLEFTAKRQPFTRPREPERPR